MFFVQKFQSINKDRDNQDTLFQEKEEMVVFFLHGLGGTAWLHRKELEKIGLTLNHNFKFILIQAPFIRFRAKKEDNFFLFLPGWYHIESREEIESSENDFGLLEVLEYIDKAVSQELERKINSKNIFFMGFSQGASVVLSLALASQYELGGFIILAGFLPYYKVLKKVETSLNKSTPILMVHGEDDKVVDYEKALLSAKALHLKGYSVDFKSYKKTGHFDIYDSSKDDIIKFFQIIISSNNKIKKEETSKEPHEIKTEVIHVGKTYPYLSTIVGTTISLFHLLKKNVFHVK